NSINAQIRSKKAQIKQSQLEYTRQSRMYKDKATSKADFDAAEADLAVQKADLEQLIAQQEQAKISVNTAEIDLGYTTINAPTDGTVVYTAVEEGQTVNANQTTPTIIELAQLDTMTVEAQISEADVINVAPGQNVYFTILGKPDHKFNAKLRAIEPGPTIMTGDDSNLTVEDSDAIYYNGLFDIPNPDNILRIGMTAQISIILNKTDDALLVPAQILKKQGKRYAVPVLENGKRVMKPVEVGINNKVQVEIKSGLNEGDQVIVGMSDGSAGSGRGRGRGPMRF
ncbi:MAG: efflux RND transporter periplasmic adaptor subunit, partial [Vibrio sp.]